MIKRKTQKLMLARSSLRKTTVPIPVALVLALTLWSSLCSGTNAPRSRELHTRAKNENELVDITIFHTSDEHGWLEPSRPPGSLNVVGGAANIRSWILEKEGFSSSSYLLLSSGDNWTGPAISTWFAGAPMVEAFNVTGYDAIAIGNHEFDFGRSVMLQRFDTSEAPYLGANIRDIGTKRLPFFRKTLRDQGD